MPKFIVSEQEKAEGMLRIHSDVWERHGHVDWEVEHLMSDWKAFGHAAHFAAAYTAINEAVMAAVNEAGYDVDEEILVVRSHYDA